jgi:Predicted GTPase
MGVSAIVTSAGANFRLLGPKDTQIKSTKPVVAVGAVRTGAGKGQTARRVIEELMKKGLKVVAARHPMPYGDLTKQECMRFATVEDLKKNNCTIEEMEEYEPHVIRGNVIYSGVDYEKILRAMEKDPSGCDVVIWDGGNNDFPFFKPDLNFVIVDPLRPGHELSYYPAKPTCVWPT